MIISLYIEIFTANERQPWTNYESNGKEHLIREDSQIDFFHAKRLLDAWGLGGGGGGGVAGEPERFKKIS